MTSRIQGGVVKECVATVPSRALKLKSVMMEEGPQGGHKLRHLWMAINGFSDVILSLINGVFIICM